MKDTFITDHPSYSHYISLGSKPHHGDLRSLALYTMFHQSHDPAAVQKKHELFLTDQQIIELANYLLQTVTKDKVKQQGLLDW